MLAAEATLKYQDRRLARNLDRLAKLEKQVELCTIRAPHDGFVIYANDERRESVIEEGMSVRQKQDLFYLPDLTDMEVVAYLHESMVNEIAQRDAGEGQGRGAPRPEARGPRHVGRGDPHVQLEVGRPLLRRQGEAGSAPRRASGRA